MVTQANGKIAVISTINLGTSQPKFRKGGKLWGGKRISQSGC